jgi:tetratricopeptide (TPR) repeat protein
MNYYDMSADHNSEAVDMCCASCGKAEVDDVKLTECDGCDLVRYCSDECQQLHRQEHAEKCKERAAELLRDEILFRQPEGSHHGDCPICCLPLPINPNSKNRLNSCCSKVICEGCSYADNIHQWEEKRQQPTCPFCRHPVPKTKGEAFKNLMVRVEANDSVAIREMGVEHARAKEYEGAFKYLTKAAELGDAHAHYELSIMYMKGECIEKDEEKETYHLEEAAVRGHASARHNLAYCEENNGRIDRAVKHFIIAANLGHDRSLQALKDCYKGGAISKEDFAAALRAHHAAVNETKSPQREAAARAEHWWDPRLSGTTI